MMLGEKIHQLRKGKGLSQEELASQLTVSRQAISKWELGESVPDTENVVQLSKLFDVSTDYLLNDDYESDQDIPAVKMNSETIKTEYRSKVKKTSCWIGGVGLFGIFIIWILSCVIPVQKAVSSTTGMGMTLVRMEDFRGNLFAFLSVHNYLIPAFTVCCLLALTGIVLLLFTLRKEKHQQRG